MYKVNYEGLVVMLLSLAPIGEVMQVKAIWAENNKKNILEEVGITINSEIIVRLKIYDDAVIVSVKEKRIAISGEITRKIIV